MFITPEAFISIFNSGNISESLKTVEILFNLIRKFENELRLNPDARNDISKIAYGSKKSKEEFYEKHKERIEYVKSYFSYRVYMPSEKEGKEIYSLLQNTNWDLVIGYTGGDFYIEISFPKNNLLKEPDTESLWLQNTLQKD